MTIFNTIGSTYNNTRATDELIVADLYGLLNLPDGDVIADISTGAV
jgi:hypothetical protein